MSPPAVKNALLIAATLLPTVGIICLERASTDGLEWLYYVGTVTCIVGAAAAVVLREQAKKPPVAPVAETVPEPAPEEE